MSSDYPTRRMLLAASALGLLESSALTGDSAAAAHPSAAPSSGGSGGPAPGSAEGPLSVKDFGAIGDGNHHPLSERFSRLDEARRTFPFVTSLDQTLDWAGIQAAVNAVEGRVDRRVHVPAGRYRISNSIKLSHVMDFFGDGPGVTFLDNLRAPLHEPQIVNAEASFVGVAIRLMALQGGTHAIRINVPNGEVAWMTLEGLSCVGQTDKNVEFDRLLQSSEIRSCGFTQAPYGVYVAGHTTNSVNFYNCAFEQHSREHLHLSGAEGVNFFGGKFEGGGDLPNPSTEERATIFLENAGAVNFHGVYFESTHPLLLKEVRSRSGVSFEGCHFTGGSAGKGLTPYRFVSDGMVTFGGNDWYLPSEGPARVYLKGFNGQKLAGANAGVEILSRSPRQQRSASAGRRMPPSGTMPLATISRVGAPPDGTILLTGDLIVQGTVQLPGMRNTLVSRRHHLRVAATAAGTTARVEAASTLDDAGIDLTIRLRTQSGEVSIVEAVLRGASGATLQWSLDTLTMAAPNGSRLDVDIPPGG